MDDGLDDIEAHCHPADGEVTLTCGDRAFDRLWAVVTDVAGPIDGAPTPVRVIAIERRSPPPPPFRWWHPVGTLGCAVLGCVIVFPFVVGVITIASWVR